MGDSKSENNQTAVGLEFSFEISSSQKILDPNGKRNDRKIFGAEIICLRGNRNISELRRAVTCDARTFELGVIIHNNRLKVLIINLHTLHCSYIFALPQRDALNRRVIFCRPGVFNPARHFNYEMIKIHGIVYESLMEDEDNQIHGFVHIIDSTGLGFHYLTLFSPHEAYRIGRNLEVFITI